MCKFIPWLLIFSGALYGKEELKEELCDFQYKLPSMGAIFEIQISDKCGTDHTKLIEAAQVKLDLLESEFSLYQPLSPVSKLNKEGKLKNPSVLFREVLDRAQSYRRQTEGYFNIQVLPILTKIQESFKLTQKPPKRSELNAMKKLLGSNVIGISASELELKSPGAALTFDGMVKGTAVDQIFDVFSAQMASGILLNFSGNMKWSGRKTNGDNWKIVAWNPIFKIQEEIFAPREGAVASSGPEHNSFSANKKWHHLISPFSLKPVNYWSQTTVVGSQAEVCDILSTSFFVMKKNNIKKVMTNFPGYRVFVVDTNGRSFEIKR